MAHVNAHGRFPQNIICPAVYHDTINHNIVKQQLTRRGLLG